MTGQRPYVNGRKMSQFDHHHGGGNKRKGNRGNPTQSRWGIRMGTRTRARSMAKRAATCMLDTSSMLRRATADAISGGDSKSSGAKDKGSAGAGSKTRALQFKPAKPNSGAQQYFSNNVVSFRKEGKLQIKLGLKKSWKQMKAVGLQKDGNKQHTVRQPRGSGLRGR